MIRRFIIRLIALALIFFSLNPCFSQEKYQEDFIEFWSDINKHHVYLDSQKIDWNKVREFYEPKTNTIKNDEDFIRFLEGVINELYNGHVSLNTNLNSSNRLIPSGSDFYVEKTGKQFFVKDIRKGFGADLAGLKIGMEVTHFNDIPVEEQLQNFLPASTGLHTPEMYQYALNMLFAGTHDKQREITVLEKGKAKKYTPVSYGNRNELVFFKIIDSNTAYVKINNSLGNYNLVKEFDNMLDSFFNYKNLVIDLTETPGGGNSTVARAILGRFTSESLPYQVHEFDEKQFDTKRRWVEYVTPRKRFYTGNVYVLVGRWTGSMGEGLAIGFDGMKKAKIIGTKMAGLLGAISNFKMTNTNIGFQIPTERLYHVNGTPREQFIPGILTLNSEETFQKLKEIR